VRDEYVQMTTSPGPSSFRLSPALGPGARLSRYVQMTSVVCEDMYTTKFAFNSLQESEAYPD